MSTADNAVRPIPDSTRRYARPRRQFGGHVAATVDALQRRVVTSKPNSAVVATMAQLRAAIGRPPGSAYAVLTQTAVPDKYLEHYAGDEPTDTEHAKHAALTLYALHQQSVYDRPMHEDGLGLGAAVSQLVLHARRNDKSPEAVRRRFAVLGTASGFDEAIFHLRTMVYLLREARIPLDYGLLAEDLVALRRPGGPEHVRARWGRDFYRALPANELGDPTAEPSSDTTAPDTEE